MTSRFDRRILHGMLLEPDAKDNRLALHSGSQSRFIIPISSIEYFVATWIVAKEGCNKKPLIPTDEARP